VGKKWHGVMKAGYQKKHRKPPKRREQNPWPFALEKERTNWAAKGSTNKTTSEILGGVSLDRGGTDQNVGRGKKGFLWIRVWGRMLLGRGEDCSEGEVAS